MKSLFPGIIALLVLLPLSILCQSYDYVSGYGINSRPNALLALSDGNWLATSTNDMIPGPVYQGNQDTLGIATFNDKGDILLERKLKYPPYGAYWVIDSKNTPDGGFAMLVSNDHCDYFDDPELLVYHPSGNLKWGVLPGGKSPVLQKDTYGNLVVINPSKAEIKAYNSLNGSFQWKAELKSGTGSPGIIFDMKLLNDNSEIITVGWPSLQRWERQDDTSFLLVNAVSIDTFFLTNKIVYHNSTDSVFFAFRTGFKRLCKFDPVSLAYSIVGEYPFSIKDLVSDGSSLIALGDFGTMDCLLRISNDGEILDTIRSFTPWLRAEKISIQNNTLAVAGRYSSGQLATLPTDGFYKQETWLHTNLLNNDPPPFVLDVDFQGLMQNAPIALDSSISNSGTIYTLKGGDFQIKIKNNGNTALESIDLNMGFHHNQNVPCWPQPTTEYHYSNINLLPGESTLLDFGDLDIGYQTILPDEICLWISAPNKQPDANAENDVACTGYYTVDTKEPEKSVYSLVPNPADEFVLITVQNPSDSGVWRLFDLTGVLWETGTISDGQTSIRINTTDIPSGAYLVSVNGANQKLIVAH